MKKFGCLLITIGLIFALASCASAPAENWEELATYEKIVDVPGKSQSEIYILANKWMVENFNSAESVIEFQDKEAGEIAGSFTVSHFMYTSFFTDAVEIVEQNLTVSIKDERVRVRVFNPIGKNKYGVGAFPIKSEKDLQELRVKWEALIAESLEEYLLGDSLDW